MSIPILTGILVVLCVVYPMIWFLTLQSCYRVRKIESVYKNKLNAPYYVIEQFHKLGWFSWWSPQREFGYTSETYNDVAIVELVIQKLVTHEPIVKSRESVSNVICTNSPEFKVKFD